MCFGLTIVIVVASAYVVEGLFVKTVGEVSLMIVGLAGSLYFSMKS